MVDEAEVIEYTVPLIDKDGGASGGTVSREDIDKLPDVLLRSQQLPEQVQLVQVVNFDPCARSSSTWVYIDGIKVRGSSALPKSK